MSATALPAAAQSFNITPDHDGTGSLSGELDDGRSVTLTPDGAGGYDGDVDDDN